MDCVGELVVWRRDMTEGEFDGEWEVVEKRAVQQAAKGFLCCRQRKTFGHCYVTSWPPCDRFRQGEPRKSHALETGTGIASTWQRQGGRSASAALLVSCGPLTWQGRTLHPPYPQGAPILRSRGRAGMLKHPAGAGKMWRTLSRFTLVSRSLHHLSSLWHSVVRV